MFLICNRLNNNILFKGQKQLGFLKGLFIAGFDLNKLKYLPCYLLKVVVHNRITIFNRCYILV